MKLCSKKWSIFVTFCDKYFIEIEKDLYICSVKN